MIRRWWTSMTTASQLRVAVVAVLVLPHIIVLCWIVMLAYVSHWLGLR